MYFFFLFFVFSSYLTITQNTTHAASITIYSCLNEHIYSPSSPSSTPNEIIVSSNIPNCPELVIRDSNVFNIIINQQNAIAKITLKNIRCLFSPDENSAAGTCIHFRGAIQNIQSIFVQNVTYDFIPSSNTTSSVVVSSSISSFRGVSFTAPIFGDSTGRSSKNEIVIDGVFFSDKNISTSGGSQINHQLSQHSNFQSRRRKCQSSSCSRFVSCSK